jgi:hypothetical protein
MSRPSRTHPAGLACAHAREALGELALAVSRDAGYADYLARMRPSRSMPRRASVPRSPNGSQALDPRAAPLPPRAGVPRAPLNSRRPSSGRARALVMSEVLARADDAAVAQHGHAVRYGHDLAELVRDEHEGVALGHHAAEGVEEVRRPPAA